MRSMLIALFVVLAAAPQLHAQEPAAEPWREAFERAAGLAQAGKVEEAIDVLSESRQQGLEDPSVPLTDARFDPIRASGEFRSTMRSMARTGPLRIVSADEPGRPLTIRCEIRDSMGKPVSSAIVYAYQTDASGAYTRTDITDEPNARIFGYVRPNRRGRIQIQTIHPGAFPERTDAEGAKRFIPEQVHLQITLWDGTIQDFQLLFENSPRMGHSYWKQWAAENGHPVAKLERQEDGSEMCQFVLRLRP